MHAANTINPYLVILTYEWGKCSKQVESLASYRVEKGTASLLTSKELHESKLSPIKTHPPVYVRGMGKPHMVLAAFRYAASALVSS